MLYHVPEVLGVWLLFHGKYETDDKRQNEGEDQCEEETKEHGIDDGYNKFVCMVLFCGVLNRGPLFV
jgi:hypothetical protein